MTAAQPRFILPGVPEPLQGLVDLALDMRWSWSHSADVLWKRLDAELWELTHNPWHILQTMSRTKLAQAAEDKAFLQLVDRHVAERRGFLEAPSWFEQTFPEVAARPGDPKRLGPIAYFCMEFGLSEALPLYSGGLGILAGDFLKTASDLGVPIIGVGLLWQQGYFRQALSATGEQIEFFPYNDPGQLPIIPLRDSEGEWVTVILDFPRHSVQLRVWEVRAGRVKLYLLDANDLVNTPADRGITSELYGGGMEARFKQEMILGIGGWRLLRDLGLQPDMCHLNEGHAAMAVLERARCYMQERGVDFEVALTATRPGNLFTTHTPVEAGFDRFPPSLVAEYLGPYTEKLGISVDRLLALGRPPDGTAALTGLGAEAAAADGDSATQAFNMAYLAIRGSGAVNGVSRLHGEVSRALFQSLFPRWPSKEVPVGYVTNGVHVPSWDSDPADALWTKACGKDRWLGSVDTLGDSIRSVSDADLWAFRDANRRTLVGVAREHVMRQGRVAGSLEGLGADLSCLCDPGLLTLGFARRFATYKRPNLLLHDPDRLERLICGPQSSMQLVLAGKAHPADLAGKVMIREWTDFIRRCSQRPHVIFLVDYDMDVAEHLVHGADVWINTPRRPWEASGTSGMKVLVNGGLNLSELDGWWAEAYAPDVGWALGDGLEHDSDPAWDATEAGQLYDLLENHIIPEFYDRDERGIPKRWIARVRESMARLAPRFSTNRMMQEYLEQYYFPGSTAYQKRVGSRADMAQRVTPALGEDIVTWRRLLDDHWQELAFLHYSAATRRGPSGDIHSFEVEAALGGIPPSAVLVELYAEPLDDGPPERHVLRTQLRKGAEAPGSYVFAVELPAKRPIGDFTPRIVPWHESVEVPLEAAHILWYR